MVDIRAADTAAIKAPRATADRVEHLATAARRVTVAPTERQATMRQALAAVVVTRVRRAVDTRLAVEVGIRPAVVGDTPAAAVTPVAVITRSGDVAGSVSRKDEQAYG